MGAWSITYYVSFYKFFKRQVTHGLFPTMFHFVSLFLKRQVTHGLLPIMFHFVSFFLKRQVAHSLFPIIIHFVGFFLTLGDSWSITYYVSFYKFF